MAPGTREFTTAAARQPVRAIRKRLTSHPLPRLEDQTATIA